MNIIQTPRAIWLHTWTLSSVLMRRTLTTGINLSHLFEIHFREIFDFSNDAGVYTYTTFEYTA
jgi:hypothetical protein